MRVPGSTAGYWIDGRPVPADRAQVSITDPAVTAGLGLFETIAIRRRRALDLADHLGRLARGADRLGLSLPPQAELAAFAREAAAGLEAPYGWMKIVMTAGGRWILIRDEMDPGEEGRALSAVLLPWRRSRHDPLVDIKSLSYARNLVGLETARRRGADEGLWLNTRGHLAEGCRSNLFVIDGRRVFTPSVGEGILPGVVRAVALRAARGLGLYVHEGRVRLRRLERAGESFLTSSLRGVCPLVRYQDRPLGCGRPGPLTGKIAAEVSRLRLDEAAGGAT